MTLATVVNRTKNNVVGTRVELADTFVSRLVGLLGRSRLDPDCGLLIQPSSGVHTFAMRFPIDVIALDRKMRVRALWTTLAPWRTSTVHWKTQSVLELAAGRAQACRLEVGDQLEILQEALAGSAPVPKIASGPPSSSDRGASI